MKDAIAAFAKNTDKQEVIDRYFDSKHGNVELANSVNRAKGKNAKLVQWTISR